MDKTILLKNFIAAVTADLQRATAAALATSEGAVHEENRAEGNKDMRATEASYLARGQAMRVEELTETLNRLQQMPLTAFDDETPISAGALVCLENLSGKRFWYWLVTHGAGYELMLEDLIITTITPRSPMGRALVEHYLDDEIELSVGGRQEQFEVIELY